MYYAHSTGGFYTTAIHGNNIPSDAIEISSVDYRSLLSALAAGKMIILDENNRPIAVERPVPARTKASMLAEVANMRWQLETSGIQIDGIHVDTSREAQSQLFSAYSSLKAGLIVDTPWKDANGTFTQVTVTVLEPLAQAVAEHIRSCFTAEEAHNVAIAALLTQADIDAYDINAGWPLVS